jgi:hypothetical protein
MGNDKSYIYGQSNGQSYVTDTGTKEHPPTERTHWDPRVEVLGYPGMCVQIGVVPPSDELSTDVQGLWDPDDGQFMQLDRSGLNRLIEALQEAGAAVFGRDRW